MGNVLTFIPDDVFRYMMKFLNEEEIYMFHLVGVFFHKYSRVNHRGRRLCMKRAIESRSVEYIKMLEEAYYIYNANNVSKDDIKLPINHCVLPIDNVIVERMRIGDIRGVIDYENTEKLFYMKCCSVPIVCDTFNCLYSYRFHDRILGCSYKTRECYSPTLGCSMFSEGCISSMESESIIIRPRSSKYGYFLYIILTNDINFIMNTIDVVVHRELIVKCCDIILGRCNEFVIMYLLQEGLEDTIESVVEHGYMNVIRMYIEKGRDMLTEICNRLDKLERKKCFQNCDFISYLLDNNQTVKINMLCQSKFLNDLDYAKWAIENIPHSREEINKFINASNNIQVNAELLFWLYDRNYELRYNIYEYAYVNDMLYRLRKEDNVHVATPGTILCDVSKNIFNVSEIMSEHLFTKKHEEYFMLYYIVKHRMDLYNSSMIRNVRNNVHIKSLINLIPKVNYDQYISFVDNIQLYYNVTVTDTKMFDNIPDDSEIIKIYVEKFKINMNIILELHEKGRIFIRDMYLDNLERVIMDTNDTYLYIVERLCKTGDIKLIKLLFENDVVSWYYIYKVCKLPVLHALGILDESIDICIEEESPIVHTHHLLELGDKEITDYVIEHNKLSTNSISSAYFNSPKLAEYIINNKYNKKINLDMLSPKIYLSKIKNQEYYEWVNKIDFTIDDDTLSNIIKYKNVDLLKILFTTGYNKLLPYLYPDNGNIDVLVDPDNREMLNYICGFAPTDFGFRIVSRSMVYCIKMNLLRIYNYFISS